jgi:protein required for attachment to host cells
MTTTRVLVAHDAGARLFDQKGPGKGLIELANIAFEDGRRSLTEINADKSGRGGGQRGGSGHGHAFEPHEDAHKHAVHHFARTLVDDLAHAHHRKEFTQLILVAPPRFLGFLRESLGTQLKRALIGTLAKDLPRATASELCAHLAPYVAC